ncbi:MULTISPECIES: hypothetical protein [unclassified Streptomyces]|uniref:hypothetical protein n=1 Tax=unclassified Streptomyces TaxID=2593676 RepID=UPI0003730A29|nr:MULTISPECIES: hypothetical protein [unclassified Streptomyces]MYT29645.1 hypothetical protein [Streptomyces sp. SID8354]
MRRAGIALAQRLDTLDWDVVVLEKAPGPRTQGPPRPADIPETARGRWPVRRARRPDRAAANVVVATTGNRATPVTGAL